MTSTTRHGASGVPTSNDSASQLQGGQRRSRRVPRLEIVVESPSPNAHLSFMSGFLAPLLAKEFLRQRRAAIPEPTSEVNGQVSTSGPFSRRGSR